MSTFLSAKACEFAAEVQELLEATLPGNHVVKAVEQGTRFVIRPAGADLEPELVQLYANQRVLGSLRISFHCEVDHQGRYLAIQSSRFVLTSDLHREPLIRLDFVKDSYRSPSAHWQLHAERGAFSAFLADTGVKAPRSLSSLHLPVGGARMRPCLEDFIEFLICECGVDAQPGWRAAISAGRVRWRHRQIAALVRDAPEDAIRVLEENGYVVTPGGDALRGDDEKLTRW
ncbi:MULTISPECIES: hypothetical protein [Protofrankia]|uniref:hypothetical protein n=1 Tax=Protofrankia TaxID=2994361 RepID=UPI000640858F|nr:MULTISPECIES: hypothetical protein [Protofrankia]ONH34117.1 hypothetical protein BL254_18215 [Protofrankia sp. BMG5.30]